MAGLIAVIAGIVLIIYAIQQQDNDDSIDADDFDHTYDMIIDLK